ncbi:MAG TPA: acyl carrier protein [Thermoanaerobaculia bacterium]|jgi:acyl carrier protein|nr:acyl carrier protein [Thermoanaerobaculia bacterium]
MQHADIEAAVSTAIRKLGLEEFEILPVYDLQTDLGIDSTELVELAALVRGELGLHTQRINLGKVKTVHDLVAEVETLLRGPAAPTAAV